MPEPSHDVIRDRYVYLVPQTEPKSARTDDLLDLRAFLGTIWSGRWTVILATSLFIMGGSLYAFLATPWYQAEIVLSPVSTKSLPGGLGQLGGLASLAGIDIPGGASGESVAVLKSKGFLREFIEDENLAELILDEARAETLAKWALSNGNEADIRDAVKYFDEKLRSVTEDKKSGLVTLSVKWKKPEQAAQWANLMAKRLNERLRAKAIEESRSSIEYLQKEMLGTTVISLQQSIGRVLESQMQKMSLARSNTEFAFKVVDVAVPPKQRKYPRRTLILFLAAILGMGAGVLVVTWREASKKSKEINSEGMTV